MTNDARARYLDLIEATLRHALTHRKPPPTRGPLTMELALPAIACRLNLIGKRDPSLIAAATCVNDAPIDASVADGADQSRSAYRPLLMRLLARHSPVEWKSFAAESKASQCRIEVFAATNGPLLAADGSEIVARLFESLAGLTSTYVPGIRSEGNAVAAFRRLVAAQSDDGRFLARSSADQLEPAWYHELAVLHAAKAFSDHADSAAPRSDVAGSLRVAVARSARYHAEQVQPDHASSQPFGLAALLDDDEGIHLADMMLHAAGVQQPATMDAVSLVLLSDVLDCGGGAQPA